MEGGHLCGEYVNAIMNSNRIMFEDYEANLSKKNQKSMQTNQFWHNPEVDPAPVQEPIVIAFPDFCGVGYINEDGNVVSCDVTINGCDAEQIAYWADLPSYPNVPEV